MKSVKITFFLKAISFFSFLLILTFLISISVHAADNLNGKGQETEQNSEQTNYVLLNDGNIFGIVGIIVSYWGAKKHDHKKIMFLIDHSENGKKSLITIWNASNVPIYGQDMHDRLVLCSHDNFNLKVVYQSDQILIKTKGKGKNHYRIAFDTLLPKQGIVLETKFCKKDNDRKLCLVGRIKGENEISVNYYRIFSDLRETNGGDNSFHVITSKIIDGISFVFPILAGVIIIVMEAARGNWANGVAVIIIALFYILAGIGFGIQYIFPDFRVPCKLRLAIKAYKEEENFYRVKDRKLITQYSDIWRDQRNGNGMSCK